MAEQDQNAPIAVNRLAIVSSAGEDDSDNVSEEGWKYGDPGQIQNDTLYGANLDDEDEAWVYKNMRSGVEEAVNIRKGSSEQLEQAKLLKPRSSDAVLSCPCCFCIVCMDCQRHERYENQYRAMFVMNIGVTWDTQLVYCEKSKTLVAGESSTAHRGGNGGLRPHHHVPMDGPKTGGKEVYYPVYCLNCQTQVAALDMNDEVYHFFGCCASA